MNTLETIVDSFRTFFATERSDATSLIPIANIKFKPETDLRRIADIIVGNIAIEQITTVDNLTEVSRQLIELASSDDSKPAIDLIDSIGLGLAHQLVSSITELKAVKSEVATLEQVVHERYVDYIKQEGAEELLGIKPATDNFVIFNWDRINSSSSVRKIIDSLHRYAGLRKDTMTASNLNYIISKLVEDLRRFTPIVVDDTLLENLVAFCTDSLKNYDTLSPEDIKKFTVACVNKQSMLQLWAEIRKLMNDKQSVPFLLTISNKLQDYVNIKSVDMDFLNTDSITSFYNNVNLLDKVQQVIKYHCIFLKDNVYKDKIVINNVYINGPEFAKIEKQGKSLEDIALFIKAVYSNKVPINGISTQVFLTKNIDHYLNAYRQKLQLQEQNIKYKCLNRAFVNSLRQYYDNIAALMGLDENSEEYKNTKVKWYTHVAQCSGKLTGDIAKLNGLLYDTLVAFLYPQSLTEQLYKRLNKAYEQLMDADNENAIMDEQILKIELQVITDVILEYLLNNYCIVSPVRR